MYPKEIKSTKDRLDYAVAMGKKIKEEEEKKKKDTLYQQAYKELSQPKQTIQPTQDEYQQAYNEVFMEYSNPEKTRRDYIPTLNTTSDKQVNNVGDALSHLGQKAIYGLAGGVSNITGGIAKTLGNPGTAIDAVLDIPESFHNAFLKNTYKVMDKENPGYYDDLSEKDKIKHDSLFNQTKTENFLDRNIDQYDDFMNWLDNNPASNVLDSVGDGYLNSNNYFRSNYNEEDMNKILKFGGDIVQGATNMIPSITVGALTGNPSLAMGTMGVNAYGGGLHQALSEGADLENAYRYGLANALTEVATESLVGGIPALGGGYADDLITKVTDKAFKTPTAKNIANKGLDLLGEGLEEYLGDIIGEFTTDIYSNEKQYEDPMQRLKDTQADALYSGLVGIGTAGLLNAPGYISEVNANRQNNASTDTIQSNILENNTLAKEPVNSEIEQAVTELEEEFYQPKQYELTQEQLDNSPFSLEELQSDGSEIIITKNELLNDNALIRDNAQKVNTQNIEIQLENSNYDKQTVATLSKLSNEYGIPLKFESLPNHINGMYHNGEIIINKNSSEPLMTVFTHELTHSLESTQTYNELVGAVVEHLNMTSDISDLNTVIDEEVYRVIQERAELGINLNYDQAHKEVIAEYISEYIADDSFINSISSNKSIVQRIVDWLKNIVTSLTGSKEQKAYKGLLNKYQKALTQVDYQPNNGIENIQAAAPFSINGDVITLQDGAKYSINKSFSDIVTEIQKNTYNNDGTNAIEVRPNTPDVLKNIGFSDLPMLITLNHTKNAMGIGNSGNQHNIDVSILKNLPNLLEDPIMIYKKDGKINMLLKSTDLNSNTMLVVIKPNGKGNYNNLEIDTNFILTAFGKEGIIRYFDKVVKQSDILYPENTTKKEVLSETLRHQLSNHNTIPRNQIISNNTKKSTPQYSINPIKNKELSNHNYLWELENSQDVYSDALKDAQSVIDSLDEDYLNSSDSNTEKTNLKDAQDNLEDIQESMAKAKKEIKDIDNFISELNLNDFVYYDIDTSKKSVSTYIKLEPTTENYNMLIDRLEKLNIPYDNYYGDNIEDYNSLTIRISNHDVGNHFNFDTGMSESYDNESIKIDVKDLENIKSLSDKAQKEYFKNSKVRDKKGNLQVYYNGSENFTVYDTNKMRADSKWGKGIYLTPYKDVASLYGPNIKQVYVNITNPINLNKKTVTFNQYSKLMQSLFEGEDVYREDYNLYSNDLDLLWDITRGEWPKYSKVIFDATGKDGIIINEGNKTNDMIIAFNSNQVKNVDNLNPTNNPDIRFSPKKEIKNNIITLNKEIPGLREKLINNSNKYLGYESTEFKNLLKNGARDILETGNITESSRNSIYDYIENNSKIGLTQDINNFVSEIKATIDNKKALIKRANKDENIIEKTTDKVHKILKTGKDLETKYSKDMERYVNEYGAIKKGEMPARNIKVPKETDKGTVKQHYRTILESPQASIEVIEALQGEIDNGNATYKPISNETLVKNSKNTDAQIGNKHMYDEFMRNDKISAQAISDGEYLLNKAMRNNNIEQTINLSQKLASMLNETGRALQSARILKRLTPEGQLTILQKEVIKINNEIETKFKNKKPVKISDELVKKFTEADTIEGKKEVLTEMQKNVGQQIPSSFADKMNQWRYLSMLGNPRTHIRNIVGNTMFQPIVGAKNVIGTIIEGTISKTGLIKDLERSKAILNPLSKQDKALIKWANDDFKNVKASFENTGKYEISKEIQSNKKVFESKIVGETLNKLSDWNSTMLDYEDEVFTKYRYSRTLAEQFKANKITPETVDGDTLVKFQDKAYKEALESVYRDANGLASAINKFRYTNKGTRFIADAIMPFTKTPMNIVKRMVEYSPVGLVKDITLGVYEVQQGKISADTYINNLSKGLTGTGIAMLGYFLASIGMFRTSDDDKDRLNKFEKDLGEQNYALVLPNGDTYTLDWMSPVIGPLGIGAELFKYIEDKSTTKNIGDIYDSLAGVLDPIMQTSMLSGLAYSLNSYDENKISGVFKSAVYSYVGQFFPTLGGQLARVFDDKRRTTYSNNSLERQVKIIMNKLPGVATLNEPYINRKGEEELTGNVLEKVFNNMINPGYYKKNTADKYDKELIRLFNINPSTNNDVIPTSYSKFSYNSSNYKFTPKESTQVNKLYGTTVRKEVSKFIDSPVYKKLSDDERVNIISKLQDYSVQMTRTDYFNSSSVADKHVNYANYFKKNGYDAYSYYINKSIPGVKDSNGETIKNSKAIITRFNLERLGIYDKIVNDYQNGRIDDEDLSYFNLNKTVINMETYKYYNQFEELYQSKDVEKILSDFDIFESTVTKYKK